MSIKSVRALPRARVTPVLSIQLNEVEDQLCTLLDACKQDLETKGLPVECRIAGGWVRDKLLGHDSNDIDIALSDMMGFVFAEHFVSFLSSKGLDVKSVAKISQNPEQSKHLETARTTVLGVEIDFVNLRSEEYAADSRIPTQVKFGTPLEDALRRDITINTLFYNVHTRSVEDHTGHGLPDLAQGIVRTPLPPLETFRDDPLRVLRCVRFASRFDFRMVPELENAARNPEIQDLISKKISRERVGEEFDKMIKGYDPLMAIRLVHNLSLSNAMFSVPESHRSLIPSKISNYNLGLGAASILHALIHSPGDLGLPQAHPLLTSQLSVDVTAKPRLFLAATLTPYLGVTFMEKKRQKQAVDLAIRESLKLGTQNHYLDGIPALYNASEVLRDPSLSKFPPDSRRLKMGLLLRDKSAHNPVTGSHWSTSLLFSLVQELLSLWNPQIDAFNSEHGSGRVVVYNEFLEQVEQLGLIDAIDAKPLLDGREIQKALNVSKAGPWTGQVINKVIEWQLIHPNGTKDECAAWVQTECASVVSEYESSQKRGTQREGGGTPQKKLKTG